MAYNPSYASVNSSSNPTHASSNQNTQNPGVPAYLSNVQPTPPLYQSSSNQQSAASNYNGGMQYQANSSYAQPQQHLPQYSNYQNTQHMQYQQAGQNTQYHTPSANNMQNQQNYNYPQQQSQMSNSQYHNQPSNNNTQNAYSSNQQYYSSNQHDWFDQYYKSLDARQLELLRAWFQSVDTDNSGAIDQRELSLMKMPGVGPFTGTVLGIEAASQLIKLFDKDGSGLIEFKEYAALHCFMDKMNTSFFQADTDKNGVLDRAEIGLALDSAGFKVSPQVTDMFYHKYNPGKGLDFVKFMQMAADIALVKSKFHWLDSDNDGRLDLDQVLRLCAELNPASTQVVYAAQSTEAPKTETGCIIS